MDLFPPGLCRYHVALLMFFPLVPHFLHVQNKLARTPGPDEDPEGSIREKVGSYVVVQRVVEELRKGLRKNPR